MCLCFFCEKKDQTDFKHLITNSSKSDMSNSINTQLLNKEKILQSDWLVVTFKRFNDTLYWVFNHQNQSTIYLQLLALLDDWTI